MDLDDAVHDGDVPALHLEDEDLPGLDGLRLVVGEEQEVSTVERRLHTATGHTVTHTHTVIQWFITCIYRHASVCTI